MVDLEKFQGHEVQRWRLRGYFAVSITGYYQMNTCCLLQNTAENITGFLFVIHPLLTFNFGISNRVNIHKTFNNYASILHSQNMILMYLKIYLRR